ncbi:hypothetical protein B1207_12005 [Legionella quinlivanii]|uniref:Uncharacterized protein n=1 Tax=Legionella quinlivanii TaxID=45073 RepID=A0A364LGW9_9GAMM|nr:hypothetical protein B1207_12005 [Legionella quinlivanii]
MKAKEPQSSQKDNFYRKRNQNFTGKGTHIRLSNLKTNSLTETKTQHQLKPDYSFHSFSKLCQHRNRFAQLSI